MSEKKESKNEQRERALSDSELDKAAGGEAVFDNFVGFYEVTDTNGGIDQRLQRRATTIKNGG